MKGKLTKIKEFESIMSWFQANDNGRPIEIDWVEKDGKYRGTLVYYRKDRGEQMKVYGRN